MAKCHFNSINHSFKFTTEQLMRMSMERQRMEPSRHCRHKDKQQHMELCCRGIHLFETNNFTNLEMHNMSSRCKHISNKKLTWIHGTAGYVWSGHNWSTVCKYIWFWFWCGVNACNYHEDKCDLFVKNINFN